MAYFGLRAFKKSEKEDSGATATTRCYRASSMFQKDVQKSGLLIVREGIHRPNATGKSFSTTFRQPCAR